MRNIIKISLLTIPVLVILNSFTCTNINYNTGFDIPGLYSPDTISAAGWLKIDSFDLELIPPSSGVQYYRDGIVFLSSSKLENRIADNHISFGIPGMRYSLLKDNSLQNQQYFSPDVPFIFPAEAVTFSSDYNTMYYTRYSESDGVEKIFKADYKKSNGSQYSWTFEDKPMSFCTGRSSYSHPALSPDGKLMVFSSNRPGSIGGMDLYATILKDGAWSDPVNLGDAVNSLSNEMFPFLDSENNLYFSSDGIEGFGGYDIYVCKFKSNTWEKPVNLSTPVNTIYDDVAFKISRKEERSALYTVKSNEGRRSIQLCSVEMNSSMPDKSMTLSQYFTSPDISHMVILALEPAVQATDEKTEAERLRNSETGGNDKITYRVQFVTSFNPGTRQNIKVEEKNYEVFEYLYSGAYRLFVGEFSSLAPAIELQNILRKNEYPAASVAAFKNNVLSFDPELLREQTKVQPVASKTVAVSKPDVKPDPAIAEAAKVSEQRLEEERALAAKAKADSIAAANRKAELDAARNAVVYRIQFASTTASKGSYKLTIAGKSYNTWEYFYKGAYRSTVGEFKTFSEAAAFQKLVRQSGYDQGFVVAFKNNIRSTDPALFK